MEQQELTTYSIWAAAYAVLQGVSLLGTRSNGVGRRSLIVLDNHDGKAAEAIQEWRKGSPICNGRSLAEVYRDLMNAAHSAR